MIKRSFLSALFLSAGVACGAMADVGAASAAEKSGPQARAFASVRQGGAGFNFKQGFKSIRKLQTGVYCLKLTGKLMPFREVITPSITVEYSASSGANLLAFYDQQGTCDDGEVGVRTLKFTTNDTSPSDDIAFVIFIP